MNENGSNGKIRITKKMRFPWDIYYKTLRNQNVRQMDRFRNKLAPYIVDHKHTNLYMTNTLEIDYEICTLQIRNVLIVHVPGFLGSPKPKNVTYYV